LIPRASIYGIRRNIDLEAFFPKVTIRNILLFLLLLLLSSLLLWLLLILLLLLLLFLLLFLYFYSSLILYLFTSMSYAVRVYFMKYILITLQIHTLFRLSLYMVKLFTFSTCSKVIEMFLTLTLFTRQALT